MAMTVTIPLDGHSLAGVKRSTRGTLALDSAYPANGYPVTARTFALAVLEKLTCVPRLGYLFEWDQTTATLRVYRPNELSSTGSQGVGTPLQMDAGNILGTTDAGNQSVRTRGPVEVATGTDLSAVTGVPWAAEGC